MNPPVAPVALAVTAKTPAAGATGVARNTTVTATFNEPVVTLAMSMTDSSGHAVVGATSYDNATRTATFTPSAALTASTAYVATVNGAMDANGNALSGPVTWSFTTAAAVAPAVVSESPTLNASNVPLNTTVTATFNESIR